MQHICLCPLTKLAHKNQPHTSNPNNCSRELPAYPGHSAVTLRTCHPTLVQSCFEPLHFANLFDPSLLSTLSRFPTQLLDKLRTLYLSISVASYLKPVSPSPFQKRSYNGPEPWIMRGNLMRSLSGEPSNHTNSSWISLVNFSEGKLHSQLPQRQSL